MLEGFGCDSVYPPGFLGVTALQMPVYQTMTKYVNMLFFKLRRDDAAKRQRMEPTKKPLYFLDVRGFYGRVGIALYLDHVALLGNACT